MERRKLATLVFCDLSGSTALGEHVDAEAVRSLMLSYFHEMRAALERHGGTVEKFVGDAVLAVFGVPEAHEDDALRACRAALEMQARVAALNEEFERGREGDRGANRREHRRGGRRRRVEPRDVRHRRPGQRRRAARTGRGAGRGATRRADVPARAGAVHAEPVEPLKAKGKSEPIPAYRLLDVIGPGPAPRRSGTPFAGRDDELRLLEHQLDAVVGQRRCRLVTVLGEPGVGKSRLTAEFVARSERGAGRARTVPSIRRRDHLLGDRRDRAGARRDPRDTLPCGGAGACRGARRRGCERPCHRREDRAAARALRGRRDRAGDRVGDPALPVARAGDRPLVVVVDDIHWAEPTLLDLLAGLPAAITDAPILVLCLGAAGAARAPPRLAGRPCGSSRSARSDVEALLDEPARRRACRRARRLAHGLGRQPAVRRGARGDARRRGRPAPRRRRLHARGRPRLARAAGEPACVARRAPRPARRPSRAPRSNAARSRARSSIAARSSSSRTPARRPHRARESRGARRARTSCDPAERASSGEAAFRFKHILVRDAAYRATAKKLRAVLHERFARWLERSPGSG